MEFTDVLNEKRADSLWQRIRQAAGVDPAIMEMRQRLLALGGIELVAPPNGDPDLQALLRNGALITGPARLRKMTRVWCHTNVAKLWNRVPRSLHYIGTGYALSDDGLWRQHSWGVKKDGTIVETTVLRSLYFGLLLEGSEAELFALANSVS